MVAGSHMSLFQFKLKLSKINNSVPQPHEPISISRCQIWLEAMTLGSMAREHFWPSREFCCTALVSKQRSRTWVGHSQNLILALPEPLSLGCKRSGATRGSRPLELDGRAEAGVTIGMVGRRKETEQACVQILQDLLSLHFKIFSKKSGSRPWKDSFYLNHSTSCNWTAWERNSEVIASFLK